MTVKPCPNCRKERDVLTFRIVVQANGNKQRQCGGCCDKREAANKARRQWAGKGG